MNAAELSRYAEAASCFGAMPMSISAWIILAIAIVIVLFGIASYNRLVAMRQQCNQAFADIDVQLRQRHDLVSKSRGDREGLC